MSRRHVAVEVPSTRSRAPRPPLGQHHEFDPRGFPGGPHAEPGLYLGVSGKHARGAKDRAQFKASLGRLLAHDFDIVCPAHDRPYRDNPKAELARLLGG